MKTMRRVFLVLVTALLAGAGTLPAAAQATGSVKMNWKIVPTLTTTVTPNYQAGFGPSGGNGSGTAPVVGASAHLGGGFVDFGNVIAGFSYLYKFAAQVSVTTNDSIGFTVYGEASTNLNGSTTGSYPISSILFWLVNSSTNNAFSTATPFQATAGTAINAGQNIQYAGAPPATALIWNNATPGTNVAKGYDYELQLPSTIPIDQFSVFIVYTVIGN